MGVVLMLPAMLLAMSSGAIFGVAFGFLISYVGSNIGNALAFWAGRYIFRDAVVAYLTKKYPKWTVLDQALSRESLFVTPNSMVSMFCEIKRMGGG